MLYPLLPRVIETKPENTVILLPRNENTFSEQVTYLELLIFKDIN